MPRLTRITTKTGDDGQTGLAGGERLRKDHPRIAAIGTIDELNSTLGLLRATGIETGDEADIGRLIEQIQHRLFDLGGELSMPGTTLIRDEHVDALEQALERLNAPLPPLEEFVLPGGNEAAARCHVARAVCRRAERDLLTLGDAEAVNAASLRYLNRLSDLLFVCARVFARRDGGREVFWDKDV